LNEVKQNSIFEKLDMDDNICDIQISNFGMIIKRRTLLYFAVVCLVTLATYLVMSSQDLDLLQENMLQGGNVNNRPDMKVPNKEMTWLKF
jgi:hypothetical protein